VAFDGNDYRKRVLASLATKGERTFNDPWTVFDLSLDVDDQATIDGQVVAVVAFWQKERQRPKYRGLVEALLDNKDELVAKVSDPARRADLRQAARASRQQVDQQKMAKLEQAIAVLTREFSGVPSSRLARLREIALRAGIDEQAFSERIGREHLIDDGSGSTDSLPSAVRRQISTTLREIARLRGEDGERETLFTFLGLPPTAATPEISARREELARRNRQRVHDREMTLTGDALALVELHLVQNDRALYLNGLVEDVKDRLRDEVHNACLISDQLSAAESEGFVRAAIAGGLTAGQARRVLAELAQEVGVPVETGKLVDYIRCASCGSPEPDDGREACRKCGSPLHQSCPSCQAKVAVDALFCAACRTDFRALAAAEEDVKKATSELRSGRPTAARALATAALGAIPSHPKAQQIRVEAEHAMRQGAHHWRTALDALANNQLHQAVRALREIARSATDVAGPAGESVSETLTKAERAQAELDQELTAARQAAPELREAALIRLAKRYPNNAEVAAELARHPPSAPAAVNASVSGSSVAISWPRVKALGEITYVITRMRVQADGRPLEDRKIGQTSTTSLEDGAPPLCQPIVYAVQAARAGAASVQTRSEPVLLLGEVTHLAAEGRDGEVVLRWRAPHPEAVIRLERSEERPDGAAGITRRIRPDADGYVDTHVSNGVSYKYTVYIEASPRIQGSPDRTPGVQIAARPRGRLAPIRDLRVFGEPGALTLTFRPPARGEPVVLRANKDATLPPSGTAMDVAVLLGFGQVLTLDEEGRVVDDSPVASGLVRYLAATVDGVQALIGSSVSDVAVRPIADLRAEDAGNHITLQWEWPSGCTEALVLWRRDTFPDGPSDSDAKRGKCTNMAYELKGGWHLDAESPGPYYFAVYPGMRDGTTLIWAERSGAKLQLRDAATEIKYSTRIRRGAMRRRVLQIALQHDGPIPPLMVRGLAGETPPTTREEGAQLGEIPATSGSGPSEASFPLTDLEPPIAIALFTADPAYFAMVRVPRDQPALVS
jgi:hypothetical protein